MEPPRIPVEELFKVAWCWGENDIMAHNKVTNSPDNNDFRAGPGITSNGDLTR